MAQFKNELAWSWSRHQMFYQCSRKIYWQYYGCRDAKGEDAQKDALLAQRLKQIRSVAMLVGGSLHAVIGERLRMRADAPAPVPAALIQDEVERRVLKRLRESRNRDWERFGDPRHYSILFEDYYGSGVTDDDRDAALALVRECVNGFASSAYARRAFSVPKNRLRIIEPDFDDMKIHIDGVLAYAAPDLVVEDRDGKLHVVDWKTGKPRKANVAQLAVYGLYVSEKLGAPLERVTAHVVYLSTGQREMYDNVREGVAEAKRRVSTYVADVKSRLTDVENNIAGDITQFPMTENRMLCRRCNFQDICDRRAPDAEPPDEDDEDD